MSCKDGGNVNVTLSAQRNSKTRLPLVEVGNYGSRQLTRGVLYEKTGSDAIN